MGRPLTARSVVASTLLGVDPPRLPTRLLVRSGELFGISQGTTRVALSRMVAAGELVAVGDGHELAGRLRERQARQQASRAPDTRPWAGAWAMAVVVGGRRSSDARAELRKAMVDLRMAELREGVWLRPDNLVGQPSPAADAIVDAQCRRFVATVEDGDASDAEVAARLWDLAAWDARAGELRAELDAIVGSLEAGDTTALAPGFVLSAAVLRHLLADPLLPAELLPPGWCGDALRRDYDRYDAAFKALWRDWFRRARGPE
ncbi:MAG TPA: PaaX family transcriptional regulator C-terminal domain-containing protein [Acidimicrobiales bacterium]|nr:PaaX family transcriptional regulator C-terminal domain-containing protein [Acidimicrobiales bacterium]